MVTLGFCYKSNGSRIILRPREISWLLLHCLSMKSRKGKECVGGENEKVDDDGIDFPCNLLAATFKKGQPLPKKSFLCEKKGKNSPLIYMKISFGPYQRVPYFRVGNDALSPPKIPSLKLARSSSSISNSYSIPLNWRKLMMLPPPSHFSSAHMNKVEASKYEVETYAISKRNIGGNVFKIFSYTVV